MNGAGSLIEKEKVGRWWPMGVAIAVFAALSLAAGISSEGFLEGDSCTHYMYARFALREPYLLANVWGRPLCTGIYAIPAAIARREGVQITSLLLAIGCALIAREIAKGIEGEESTSMRDAAKRRRINLAGIFVLAQPLVFLHSFSELTELPFAALLGVAFLLYQRKRWGWMALVAGMLPLGRPEGFGFVLLAAAALVMHRQWKWIPLCAAGIIAWDVGGWMLYGEPGHVWTWLGDNWPYAATSVYERGSIVHFVMLLPAVTSPIIFPATVIGLSRFFRGGKLFGDHRARCVWLIAGIPAMVLAGHSVLYATGKMASSGELRYMLIAAPFWGLLAAEGWERMVERWQWRHVYRWAAVAALFPVVINNRAGIGPVRFGYKVLPLSFDAKWKAAREVANSVGAGDLRKTYPKLLASHTAVYYFLDESPSGTTSREWCKSVIDSAPPETLLIWERESASYNADTKRIITLEEIRAAGWVEVPESIGGDWHVFHSPG